MILTQVEELRSQLRLLQAVGFGSVEGEDGHQVEQIGPGQYQRIVWLICLIEQDIETLCTMLAEGAVMFDTCAKVMSWKAGIKYFIS